MKFWHSIAFIPMEQLADVTIAAEKAGFEGVGLAHHLITPQKIESPYPYTEDNTIWWDPTTPFPDPFVTAASLGALTSRIKFITSIFILPLLDPLVAAKAISTAAYLLPDRLILGVAAGWLGEEYEAVDVDFASHGRRLDESIAVVRKLLSGGMVEHSGEFFHFGPVQMAPLPANPVPIYGGGHSPAALRRTARLDGWFTSGPYEPDDAEEILLRLKAARVEAGTIDKPFECIIGLTSQPDKDVYRRMEAAGATSVVIVPAYYLGNPNPTIEERVEFIESFARDYINAEG